MLQRKENGEPEPRLITHGFLVSIEAEEGVAWDKLALKIHDGLSFVEGVGTTDVTYMGNVGEEPETHLNTPIADMTQLKGDEAAAVVRKRLQQEDEANG